MPNHEPWITTHYQITSTLTYKGHWYRSPLPASFRCMPGYFLHFPCSSTRY